MVDYQVQRENMVESQVRPSDVTDRRVIRAMLEVAREAFLPEALRSIAYMDGELVVATPSGPRTVLSPRTVARMIQALDIPDTAGLVLVTGCPTGYRAAIAGRIAQTVVVVEPDAELAKAQQTALAQHACEHVAVVGGTYAGGHADEGPYDAILVAGSVEQVQPVLLDQLKDGGKLVAIEAKSGRAGLGVVTRWQRSGISFGTRALFEAGLAPLAGFERPRAFAL